MPSIQLISGSAERVDSNASLVRESNTACACMDLEFVISEFLNVMQYFNEMDVQSMREIYTGEYAADIYVSPSLQRLYDVLTHARSVLLPKAERFEKQGYDVKRIAEVRAIDFNDYGLFALLRTHNGEEVAPPRNLKMVLDQINNAA